MDTLKPGALPPGDRSTTLRRYGLRIQYDPNSYIGTYLHYRRLFEPSILKAIEANLRPGATFIDIGANIGQHTLVASKLVGPTGRVISFEPGANTRARLLRNIEINGLTNVDVRPYGLSREAGSHTLYNINTNNDGQATLAKPPGDCPSETVELRTLDEQVPDLGTGCVVKIDVEGAETEVLRGGQRFLRNCSPRMLIECIDGHLRRLGSSSAELFQLLQDHGYKLFALQRVGLSKAWRPVSQPVDCDLMAMPG
ncbi:FkbM family methyltransferase [Steroidobacter flavus]|uniref:FkbM family methyltransferase n=1 Tax=Steroidobacter flavus TaxID=1842136 RepID=A0ABV8SK77_9GAMM